MAASIILAILTASARSPVRMTTTRRWMFRLSSVGKCPWILADLSAAPDPVELTDDVTTSGSLAFADVDLSDSHSATISNAYRIDDPAEVDVVARRIIARLAEPYVFDGVKARLSASVGIALYPQHAETAEKLIDMADAAMYAVKEAGRNAYRIAV